MARDIVRTSKKLSWLLRHGAAESGLKMDEAGWVSIDSVLRVMHLGRADLDLVVRDNNKQRYQIQGDRIRAVQGHSSARVPVSLDELEASWAERTDPTSVWHGTTVAAVEGIATSGILPISRTHVHLAPAPDSVVGKRAAVQVLLEVSPAKLLEAGVRLFNAPNGVVLARRVPVSAIVRLVPSGRVAEARAGELRRRLGIGE